MSRTTEQPKSNRFNRKNDIMGAIGERIRLKRHEAGLTILQLARACEVTENTVGNAENGLSCSVYLLVAVADVFDCTLDDLVPV